MANLTTVYGKLEFPYKFFKDNETFLMDYFENNFKKQRNGFVINFDLDNLYSEYTKNNRGVIRRITNIPFSCTARWYMDDCWHYLYQGDDDTKNNKFKEVILEAPFKARYIEFEPDALTVFEIEQQLTLVKEPLLYEDKEHWTFKKDFLFVQSKSDGVLDLVNKGLEKGYNLCDKEEAGQFMVEQYLPWAEHKEIREHTNVIALEFSKFLFDKIKESDFYQGIIISSDGSFSSNLDYFFDQYIDTLDDDQLVRLSIHD